MPEQSRRPRRLVQTLCQAHEVGQLIRVRCINCNITRHYLAGDLVVGDIPFWDVDRHMRCERCKRRDLNVDILRPSASEGMKICIRRPDGAPCDLA
jgi:hypothetical protein